MKRLLGPALSIALVLSCASAHAKKPNPADYTIPVHITACEYGPASTRYGPANTYILQAVINTTHLQLSANAIYFDSTQSGLLQPGDYKAKLLEHSDGKTTYLSYDEYELLLPDGHTLKAIVTGIYESTP